MKLTQSHLALFFATASRTIPSSSAFAIRRPISQYVTAGVSLAFKGNKSQGNLSQAYQFGGTRSFTRTTRNMSTTDSSPNTTNSKVALLQFKVTEDKATNHATASSFLQKANEKGASLVVLPEIWNSPYATTAFREYAESLPPMNFQYDSASEDNNLSSAPSAKLLFEAAMEYNMYIIGGSIPEIDGDEIYNTCLCISPEGKLIGKHRKVHLFDIDVPGGITFRESDTLSPGNDMTAFDAGAFGSVGVGICYDIRFPEYALLLNKKYGCNLLIYPGAFNMTTGPAHWELLQRARAVDNQCFVITASPARTEEPTEPGKYKHYTAWGHSTVISPWGEVVGTCGSEEDIVVVDLDLGEVKKMREGIPTANQKREDMYKLSAP